MIGRLHGILLDKQDTDLVVDVGGVGYEVVVSQQTLSQLPVLNHSVTLYTQLIVREDAHLLYGFATNAERQLFRILLRVNGVGPKLAITILSYLRVTEFVSMVQQNAVTELLQVPGIGKRTAERLIVELRDRLSEWSLSDTTVTGGGAPATAASQDAISALVALGYKPQQARQVVQALAPSTQNSEVLIRLALQQLAS